MKRILTLILSLIMVFSLFSVMSVSALADEGELTIVLTGGTGTAIGGEGIGFATAAAIKATYDSDAVLMVDAGGFDAGAAAIMTAAGYDLVVPDTVMADWAITSISMSNPDLKAGAMFEKNGVKVAFVGVAPMGDMDSAAYYEAIQGAVTAARDTGAEFVIALGLVSDANALIKNVPGISAILTYGETAVEALSVAVEESAEDEEETEESEETEEAAGAAAQALLVSVGSDFESIGIVTIKGNMLYAETVNDETVDALDISESEIILALESAFQSAQTGETEEPVEETEEPVEETEEPVEETEEPVEETEEPVEETEEPVEETEEPVEETEEPVEETEEPVEETEEPVEETEKPVEETEDTVAEGAADTEGSSAGAASDTDADADSDGTADETGTDNASASNANGNTNGEEKPSTDLVEYIRGLEDLELTFEHPIDSVKVNGSVFEDRYYTLSDDRMTIAIDADVLNAWGNGTETGNYQFTFSFTDGTEDEVITVNISGTAPTPSETEEPDPTATPEPTKEPSATPAPEKNANSKGNNTPATGDTSPIGLYAAILGVMVVALAVVIVLVVRKNKTRQK